MTNQLFLKPEEGKFLSMSVVAMVEDLTAISQNVKINWNTESRKHIKDMLAAGKSLRIKLEKLGFDTRDLPPFIEGEETDYLTKPS